MDSSDHDKLLRLEDRVWILERIAYGAVVFMIYCGTLYLFPKIAHSDLPELRMTMEP
jgi:hypothetical protein